MPSLTTTKQYRIFSEAVQSMLRVSEELAVMRIQKVKDKADTINATMAGVQSVFEDVRHAQQQHVSHALSKQTAPSVAVKRVVVLLSAHNRFSGSLHQDVFAAFQKELETKNAEIIVVGAVGNALAHRSSFFQKHPYTYLDIDLETATPEQLQPLLLRIAAYDEVSVFASQYHSLMTQSPLIVDATGSRYLQNIQTDPHIHDSLHQETHFLFEPSLPELLGYFEQEMSRFLVELSISGSQIAHLGARIQTLERAVTDVEHTLAVVSRRERGLKKRLNNRKQQQRISGIGLWG